jgi:hypothetical protein
VGSFALSWLIPLIVLVGWGRGLHWSICRFLNSSDHPAGPGVLGLLGVLPLGSVASLIHVAVPVSGMWPVCLAIVGATFFPWRRIREREFLVLGLLGLVGAVAVLFTLRPAMIYDAGLYHLQLVRWTQAEALPLGLGNLHSRFAFNSLIHPLAAALSYGGYQAFGPFILNALLFVLVLAAFFEAASDEWFAPGVAVGLLIFSDQLFRAEAHSPSTDLPSVLFILAATVFSIGGGRIKDRVILSWVLAWTAALMKLSCLVFAVALIGIGCFRCWRDGEQRRLRAWIPLLIISIPWLVRGYLASGCLLFPNASSCLELHAWSMSVGDAAGLTTIIREWAQWRGPTPEGLSGSSLWISSWLSAMAFHPAVLLLLFSGLMAIVLGARGRRKRSEVPHRHWRDALVAHGLSLVAWFFLAPDIRFAYGTALSMVMIFTVICIDSTRISWSAGRVMAALGGLLVLRTAMAAISGSAVLPNTHVPQARGKFVVNRLGTRVTVPEWEDQCWDLPLPCAPHLSENLQAYRTVGERLVFTGNGQR